MMRSHWINPLPVLLLVAGSLQAEDGGCGGGSVAAIVGLVVIGGIVYMLIMHAAMVEKRRMEAADAERRNPKPASVTTDQQRDPIQAPVNPTPSRCSFWRDTAAAVMLKLLRVGGWLGIVAGGIAGWNIGGGAGFMTFIGCIISALIIHAGCTVGLAVFRIADHVEGQEERRP